MSAALMVHLLIALTVSNGILLVNASKPPRVMAVTETPYSAAVEGASFSCLMGSQEGNATLDISRYVRQGADTNVYTLDLPVGSSVLSPSDRVKTVYLPVNTEAQGTFSCGLTEDGQRHDIPITLLHVDRRVQAQDGKSTMRVDRGARALLRCERVVSVTLSNVVWRRLNDFTIVRQPSSSLSHLISSVGPGDAGIYGCYVNGLLFQARLGVVRLIVRECPAGKWSAPLCKNICDFCYNGGVCDDKTGECICPPGFTGPNCLNVCDKDSFGWDCEFSCGPGQPLIACRGSHMCMPDPYGCSCAAGYTGTYCMEDCPNNTFGAGCTKQCHCASGGCLPHSGECMDQSAGCVEGWSGTNCQVPDICPFGYYGPICADKCHCEDDSQGCDRITGYCSSTEGNCAPGFISATGVNLENCQKFVGCYSQCTRTCHCSGGEADCISNAVDTQENGMCLSQTCDPAWVGTNCAAGILEQTSTRANPGQSVNVTCVIINPRLQPPNIIDSSYLRQGSPANDTSYPASSSSIKYLDLHGGFFPYSKQEYSVSGLQPADKLYCVHEVGSGMAVAQVTVDFYVLPRLGSPPVIVDMGDSWIDVMWPAWNTSEGGTGEGPVVSYSLYVKESGDWELEATFPHAENMTAYAWNISDLEYGLTYEISVSVSREGPGGEGEMSEALVATVGIITVAVTGDPPMESLGPLPPDEPSVFAVVFVVLCAIAIILLLVPILAIFIRRRRSSPKRHRSFTVSGYRITEDEKDMNHSIQEVPSDEADAVNISEDTSLDEPVIAKPVATVKPSMKRPQYPPVPIKEFTEYFWASIDNGLLEKQFKALPEDLTQSCLVAKGEEHRQRNRYRNILAYDHNRVVLKDGDDPVHGYINASYIKGYSGEQSYIASQGPNTASVNDFWKMIWQEDVGKIVMATNLNEDGKNKCFKYWPDVNEDPLQFGSILVATEEEELSDCCVRREITITKGKESKSVLQFHYVDWPDKDVPQDTSGVLRLLEAVKMAPNVCTGPIVIHCSAGAGRSGVLLAVSIQQEQAARTGEFDVFNCVMDMRDERPWMVQTPEQYIFVHKLLMEWLLCKDTYIKRDDFMEYSSRLKELNTQTGKTDMSVQFKTCVSLYCTVFKSTEVVSVARHHCRDDVWNKEDDIKAAVYPFLDSTYLLTDICVKVLNQILPVLKVDPKVKGLQPENSYKNRDPTILPVNRYRPYLITEVNDPDSTNYINASFIDGMSTKSEFIVTQMPLPHTILDFWRLVHDYRIKTIVMLNNMDKKDQSCQPYWGRDEPLVCGENFRITMTALEKREDVVERTLVLENLLTKSLSEVKQFQMKRWPNDQLRAPSMEGLVGFIRLVREYLQANRDRDETLLVHCIYGASRSGVFCAALSCINQLEERGGVDVVQTIKQLKQCQPLIVQTEEEFGLVYDIITMYLSTEGSSDSNHMYENIPPGSSSSAAESSGPDVVYENLGTKPSDLRNFGTIQIDTHI